MRLDPWQQEVLNYDGDLLLNTGRQVGKTTIFARKGAEYLVNHPKCRIVVVSLTEDQAQLIIVMMLDYLERHYKKLIAKKSKKPTKSRIWLTNNASVISRPVGNTGDAVRGFTGDVLIVDEASRMPEMMWKAAKPALLTTAGQIWMCSTPFGKQGYFYECWLNKSGRWKVFHVNSVDVMKERKITKDWTQELKEKQLKFLEQEKEDMTELEFGQEYLGIFSDDLQQWFPDELIMKCMTEQRHPIHPKKNNYLGVDIARMGEDESTFEIINIRDGELYHIENQITTKTLLSDTTNHIIDLNRLYDFCRIFIDDEGIGVGVLDHLLDNPHTKRKVIGIKNSKQVIDKDGKTTKLQKTLLYTNLKMLMEQGKIHLLKDEKVFQSLKSVQYQYINNEKGNVLLKIFGKYTHIAEGLVRSAWCVKYKPLNIWLSSINLHGNIGDKRWSD